MNNFLAELRPFLYHHEHISGRFIVDWRLLNSSSSIGVLMRDIKDTSGKYPMLDSVEIDLNNVGGAILCIWINFEEPLVDHIQMSLRRLCMAEYGMNSTLWYNQETGGTCLSTWMGIPEDMENFLIAKDAEWSMK